MSEKELLNVKDLVVDVEEKEILHGVNLTIRPGETHVLMGPNGTGKSTLGYTLLGNPRYTVKSSWKRQWNCLIWISRMQSVI